jgi:hypothetical protein
MAFHIVTNCAMFIWEDDDDLHLGRINNHHIDMPSHMNCILFFFSLLIIFSSNLAKKRMSTINLSMSLPKSSMQEELMIKTTFKTYLSRIVSSSSWISNIKDPRFDLSVRIQTQNMEEQTLSVVLEALRKGQCIAILDSNPRKLKLTFSS